jgi:hypothetical protein
MCECNALASSLRNFDYTISFWSLEVLVNVKIMKIKKCEQNENKKCEYNENMKKEKKIIKKKCEKEEKKKKMIIKQRNVKRMKIKII